MNSDQCKNYLQDLGSLLVEKMLEAKKTAGASKGGGKHDYDLGRLMAFCDVVSLMQQQAAVFDISLSEIGLADIDPENSLL